MLEAALAAGIAAAGATPSSAACFADPGGRDPGPQASASTWPWSSPPPTTPSGTTGFKFFSAAGTKLDDADRGPHGGAGRRGARPGRRPRAGA